MHICFITDIYLGIKTVSNNNTSLLVSGDMGKLGTRISVISVEAAYRNNVVAQWSNEYPLALIQSWYAAIYDMKFCSCYGS